ncbi:MAG: ATP-binding protein, partial [Mycobacterium sp.]|nr:ATP-binding protein [Mycobacterium sp.]
HGDAPLESSAGTLMADLVVEEGLSMILDLSGFGSRAQERTFASAFLDRLYRTNTDLVHLIVDEADLFAAQKPRREDTHLLVTMENIVRRGRNKGIGCTLASQRAAVLNKDVLTQVDALVALRVAAPQDRDAIRDWVRGQGDEQTWSKIAPSLPGLANGECWWWIPEKHVLQRVQVRATRTFDSSPTRKRGQSTRTPKTFADVDLAAISDRIAATIERAKATDPKELAKRVRELENALAARGQGSSSGKPKVVEVPVLDEALVDRLETAANTLTKARDSAETAIDELLQQVQQAVKESQVHTQQITNAVDDIASALNYAHAATSKTVKTPLSPGPSPASPASSKAHPAPPVAVSTSAPAAPSDAASDVLTPARQRLLDALRSLEDIGITVARKTQLALWAGVSPKSGGFANNLGALRTAGLIDYPASGHVALTSDGRALTVAGEQVITNNELHQKVQLLVNPARWRILAALIQHYPNALPKVSLAETVGVSATSGGFANNLGALRTLGLLDYPTPGHVVATDILFLEGGNRPWQALTITSSLT